MKITFLIARWSLPRTKQNISAPEILSLWGGGTIALVTTLQCHTVIYGTSNNNNTESELRQHFFSHSQEHSFILPCLISDSDEFNRKFEDALYSDTSVLSEYKAQKNGVKRCGFICDERNIITQHIGKYWSWYRTSARIRFSVKFLKTLPFSLQ